MDEKTYVMDLLKRALDDMNFSLDESEQMVFSEDLCFIGKNSDFDSMDRVCMIEFIESTMEEEKNISIELLNDPWFANTKSCSFLELGEYLVDCVKRADQHE